MNFYAFVGPGVLELTPPRCRGPARAPTRETADGCAVTGLKVGANFGVGIHSFINQFVALNLELRDVYAPNNASGRDVNGDRVVDNNDIGWGSTYIRDPERRRFLAVDRRHLELIPRSTARNVAEAQGDPLFQRRDAFRDAARSNPADRSVSWIIQAAWKIAREEVRRLPGMGGLTAATPEPEAEPVRGSGGAGHGQRRLGAAPARARLAGRDLPRRALVRARRRGSPSVNTRQATSLSSPDGAVNETKTWSPMLPSSGGAT